MPPKGKLNLEAIRASLNTMCTHCGYSMPPSEVVRIDFDRVKCSKCGAVFEPKKKA